MGTEVLPTQGEGCSLTEIGSIVTGVYQPEVVVPPRLLVLSSHKWATRGPTILHESGFSSPQLSKALQIRQYEIKKN
jgi:hypothetical protein